jgi:DsbC/DsbD-like thiol-disulfide interchange protein
MRPKPLYQLSVAAALVTALRVAPQRAQTPVHWTASSAGTVAPGATVDAHISAAIDSGWHVYSLTQGAGGPIAMRITLAAGQPFALKGNPTGPAPHTAFDPNFGIQVELYEKSATFTVPVAVATAAPPGRDSILVRPRYQVCNASLCLPPRTETVVVPVTVTGMKKPAATS